MMQRPRKKKPLNIESFFKKYQYSLTAVGLLSSIIISIIALIISLNAQKQAAKQFELEYSPNFSFNIEKNDSTSLVESINFFPTKDYIRLENIELFFDYNFEESSYQHLFQSKWQVSNFEETIRAVFDMGTDPKADGTQGMLGDDTFLERTVYSVPLIVQFNYIEKDIKKQLPIFYLAVFKVYNGIRVSLKNLYLVKEMNGVQDYSQFLEDYSNIYGYRNIIFSDSKELDSILNSSTTTKDFYSFFKNNFRLVVLKTKTGYSVRRPYFVQDFETYKSFNDSLFLFKKNKYKYSQLIAGQIDRIDSFMKKEVICFEDDCNGYCREEKAYSFAEFVKDIKLEQYLYLTHKEKLFSDIPDEYRIP